MADTKKMTEEDSLKQLDEALKKFNNYLNGENNTLSTLRGNWIYLQIYATYGLRLPNDAASLRTTLNLTATDAAGYPWFDSMWGAYDKCDQASKFFFTTFDKITSLGTNLKSYATDVAGQDSTFTLISSLVKPTDGEDPDLSTALDLLTDLKDTATKNAALAGEILSDLGTYKGKLVDAQGDMTDVKTQIDKDDRTSQDSINKLQGGADVAGSLAQLNKMLDDDNDEYQQDVTIASTTVTYAWVMWPLPPLPLGLIAAATVAGIYGKKAVDMKDTIDKLEAQIKTADATLSRALSTQNTVTAAQKGLNKVLKYTNIAIEKTTQVQNSWSDTAAGLTYISEKVSKSIKTQDDAEKLANTRVVALYMKRAQEKWTDIQPAINDMVDNPYITVSPNPVDPAKFANEVMDEVNRIEKAS